MSANAPIDILLMERTMAHAVPASGSAAPIEIPTIMTQYGPTRPVAAIVVGHTISAGAEQVNISWGPDGMTPDAVALGAATLSMTAPLAITLGQTDVITVVSQDAEVGNLLVRWLWPNKTPMDGIAGVKRECSFSTLSATMATVTAEAVVDIPEKAVELVIVGATEDFTYRVDDGAANGAALTLEASDVSVGEPFVIAINSDDRLRIARVSADGVLSAYWVLADV